jgi:hypothetical protein
MITLSILFNFASRKSHEGKPCSKCAELETEIQDAQSRCNSLSLRCQRPMYNSGVNT